MRLSIIVPVCDEGERISATLDPLVELRQLGGMACIFAGLAIIDGRIIKAIFARPRAPEIEKVAA